MADGRPHPDDLAGQRVAGIAIACALARGGGPEAVRAVRTSAGGDGSVLARAHMQCLARETIDRDVRRRAAQLIQRARRTSGPAVR